MARWPTSAFPVAAALIAASLFVSACGGSTSDEERNADEAPAQLKPASVEFATFPSITRLTPNVDVDDAGTSIDLEAARGEREGGQLVAWAAKGEPRVVLQVGDLRAKGGARIKAG